MILILLTTGIPLLRRRNQKPDAPQSIWITEIAHAAKL
jgi:hypothetical protein